MKRKIFVSGLALALILSLALGILSGCGESQIFVERIVLTKDTVNLKKNETHILTYAILPADATDMSVEFVSGNDKIVTVSEDGKLIAKMSGRTTVTIKSRDGKATAECNVTVAAPAGYTAYSSGIIQFVYPSNWIKQDVSEEIEGGVNFQPSLLVENPSFAVASEPKTNVYETMSLTEYQAVIQLMIDLRHGFTPTVSLPVRSTVTYNEISCTKITFSMTLQDIVISQEQYIIHSVSQTSSITFTLGAFDNRGFIDVVMGELSFA